MKDFSLSLLVSASLTLVAMSTAMPSRSAEKVECGDGAKVQVINGVIVCTVEKQVSKEVKCNEDIKLIKRIPVYYADPTALKTVLDKIGVPCGSIIGENTSPPSLTVLGFPKKMSDAVPAIEDAAAIRTYERRIAELDLPRERVNMEMWAIQISSADSDRLASVMDQVNREIDHTRRAMQVTYDKLTSLAREIEVSPDNQWKLQKINFETLLSDTGTNGRQRLSLTDALMRISFACTTTRQSNIVCGMAGAKQTDVYNRAALNLCKLFADKDNVYHSVLFARYNQFEGREQKEYALRRIITGDTIPPFRRPFQRFQEVALHQQFPSKSQPTCRDGEIQKDRAEEVMTEWKRRQNAVLDFLDAYNTSKLNPDSFDPALVTTSAAQLDGLLGPITDALNQDIEEYFIRSTLHRIKKIVGRYRNVEYAEVGRTTVTGLNGLESKVSSTTDTSFDEPTPLRLNNLIKDASESKTDVDKLFPTLQNVPVAAGANSINASSAISLLAALSKEEVRWRAMSSGVDLTITPTVLRDRTAAQLQIDLTIADPAEKNISTRSISEKNPLRTPSRISKSTLTTKVKVNTMDLFALSSFNNQTTVTGRRWYVPLIGPIWEGVFGDIPVVGNLFSPIRPPINIQHQSIILANTLIVPTAIGLTEWYEHKPN